MEILFKKIELTWEEALREIFCELVGDRHFVDWRDVRKLYIWKESRTVLYTDINKTVFFVVVKEYFKKIQVKLHKNVKMSSYYCFRKIVTCIAVKNNN